MLQHSMVRLHSFIILLRNGMLIQMSLIMMEEALYTGLYYMLLICLLVISARALCNIPPCCFNTFMLISLSFLFA